MAHVNSKSNGDALEAAFRFIREGNELTEAKGHWKAADNYSQARNILQQLCEEAPQNNDEQIKITALYLQQSADYLQRARGSIVSALQQETAEDRKICTSLQDATTNGGVPQSTLLNSLSEDECVFRMKLFGRLFAKELDDPKSVPEQQSSLEARLQQLNDSLPRAFKTEKERMRDLNRGLARLGVSNYTEQQQQQQGHVFGIADAVPKTESEQLDWIIAQAKDEVAVTGGPVADGTALAEAAAAGLIIAPDVTIDVPLINDSDSEDALSMDDEDANLTPKICSDLRSELVAAQVSLSELIALFEVDQGNDAEIEFNQAQGKKLLNNTRVLLRQVTEKWNAC
jgi:hypothetical protein